MNRAIIKTEMMNINSKSVKKFLIFYLYSLLICNVAFSQSLFIVHPHKYYLEDVFSSARDNYFVDSLKLLNNVFSEKRLDKYWVFDNKDHFFDRRFPIKRRGAKKIRSEWGTLPSGKFKLNETIILSGLYFNQCVSRAYISILSSFINDPNLNQLDIHFPMDAIITYANKHTYSTDDIKNLLKDARMYKAPYKQDFQSHAPTYDLDVYINNNWQYNVAGSQRYGQKKLRLYFWTKTKDLLSYLNLN